jgi:hypothetical protein
MIWHKEGSWRKRPFVPEIPYIVTSGRFRRRPVKEGIPGIFKSGNLGMWLVFFLLLIIFIAFKIPFLKLPFYWDEAWSYATAVFDINAHGFLKINPDLTRGHPLFFYYLSAVWMRVAGKDPASVHILPLVVSCILLTMIYVFTGNMFNDKVAIASVALFGVQSVFLAQSGMLLPEILLSMLLLASIYFWIKGRMALFAFFSIISVLTKESALAVIIALYIPPLLKHGPGPLLKRCKPSVLLAAVSPVMAFIIFMISNKLLFGWYLYPGHLGIITKDPAVITDRGRAYISSVFMQNGRMMIIITALVVMILKPAVIRHPAIKKMISYFLSVTLIFGIFSAVNFFTSRYQLTVLPLFFITSAGIIYCGIAGKTGETPENMSNRGLLKAVEPGVRTFFAWTVMSVLLLFSLYHTFIKMHYESDISIYYRQTVELHKEVVEYAERQGWNDNLIYTAFLMQYDLAHPDMGYLAGEAEPFTSVKNISGLPYDLYIFCSNENDNLRDSISGESSYILIKRFVNNNARAEIYASQAFVNSR